LDHALETLLVPVEVLAIDSGEIDKAYEKIIRLDFRACYIGPSLEGELIDDIFGGQEFVVSTDLDEPRDDFDVEQPSRHKGLLK